MQETMLGCFHKMESLFSAYAGRKIEQRFASLLTLNVKLQILMRK